MNPRRRRLVGVAAASALAAPFVRAQPRGRMPLLVVAIDRPDRQPTFVLDTLAKEGFVEGRNLRVAKVLFGNAPADVIEARAEEAIAMRPDAIFTSSGPEVVLLQHLTRDIPIVFFNSPVDPAKAGLIASVARPGGNLTGSYHDFSALVLKRWALFKEVLPNFRRGGWLVDAANLETPRWRHREAAEAYARGFLRWEEEAHAEAEKRFGITIARMVLPAGSTEEDAVVALRRERPEAARISVTHSENGPLDRYLISARILNDLVVRAGVIDPVAFRAAVAMLPRVLRGDRPATIPAFQGTRYLVKVNPGLAKVMGIELPQSVLLQAEVIEKWPPPGA
jgi:putative ABC transport system substrate-binding protein